MDITRINNYTDSRFSPEVLDQHGAFVIDGKYPCSFKIIGETSAEMFYHDYSEAMPIIEQFRFFTEHITEFYDDKGNLIAQFPPLNIVAADIDMIQPSQFYADEDKLKAVSTFIKSGEDIIIPVILEKETGRYISLDGHTRMYYAYTQGWTTLKIFETETNDYIWGFVEEAKKRGITKVSHIEKLPHDKYRIYWDKFCDDFFAEKTKKL